MPASSADLRRSSSPPPDVLGSPRARGSRPAGAAARSEISGWGNHVFDSSLNEGSFAEIAADGGHTLARRADGSVVAFGSNERRAACQVPELPDGLSYTQLAAGRNHSLALRSDGSAVAWGLDSFGSCAVPVLRTGERYLRLGAGHDTHVVARRSDGGSFVIPPAGGLDFRAQNLQLGAGLPFVTSPVRALRLVP